MTRYLFAFLLLLSAARAQTVVQTTLASAVSASDTDFPVVSVSGVTTSMYGYVDRELVRVSRIIGSTVTVIRGQGGVVAAHASSAAIYFGAPGIFKRGDPSGPCAGQSWINIGEGTRWTCSSGTWVRANVGSVSLPTSGTAATLTGTETLENKTLKNPILANGTEGTCNAAARGKLVAVQGGEGVADTVRVCVKGADDNYSWNSILTPPE